jgi:hypothetical protein
VTDELTIRKITSSGVVTTLAGSAGNSGSTDGTGSAARFSYPHGIAVDGTGNVYVADRDNHTIRKITSGGVVTTLGGLAGNSGSADGTGSGARFNGPFGVAVDSAGNLYVTDTTNHTIRKGVAATSSIPAITAQPQSQTVNVGQSTTFSVVATGTVPLSYVWKKDGAAIAGATSASYTIASAQTADAGSYTVVVTNTVGSATSDPAVLTIAHSADVDGNLRIGLIELTRVIELYNTRLSTVRTGRYKVLAGTEDGFAQDAAATANQTLTHYHSADSNRDGQISLGELTRVIELYNTRSGTVRTGQYHVSPTPSEDGFAPGP